MIFNIVNIYIYIYNSNFDYDNIFKFFHLILPYKYALLLKYLKNYIDKNMLFNCIDTLESFKDRKL